MVLPTGPRNVFDQCGCSFKPFVNVDKFVFSAVAFVCLFLVLSDDAGQCWQREWLPTLAALQLPFVCSSLDQTLHPSSKLSVYLGILFVCLCLWDQVAFVIVCLSLTLFVCSFSDETRPFTPQKHLFILVSLFVSETRPMVVIHLPLSLFVNLFAFNIVCLFVCSLWDKTLHPSKPSVYLGIFVCLPLPLRPDQFAVVIVCSFSIVFCWFVCSLSDETMLFIP